MQSLAKGNAAALNELGQTQEVLPYRLTSLERSRQSIRQSRRVTSPDTYYLSLPLRMTDNPDALTTYAPSFTNMNLDHPTVSTLAVNTLVPAAVPLRRSARLLSKIRPADYSLVDRSEDWRDRRTSEKEPLRGQGSQGSEDLFPPRSQPVLDCHSYNVMEEDLFSRML